MFNLMRSYYQFEKFEDAQGKAKAILELKNIEAKVKWDAYDILAQTSIVLGDSIMAESAFKVLEKSLLLIGSLPKLIISEPSKIKQK